ncbi:dimethylamine monooxygenase subunit DmmA family protein [Arthrobacter cavernae]|uniref:dimethylamine monooxygenase subunit DmmA family protein n=1 Tax=Arthrobacter cavernae TaxID=2817681 RepID=UPI00241882BE|nr:dimethylamine monooxygenase subunit DmmA family protein [Arthrobacter cavernae]
MPPAAGTGLEPGFRGVICASFGSTGDTAEQHSGGRPRHDLRFESANPETLSDLRSALGRSHVGVRLVLAGPQSDIRAAAAAAAECGLLEEEVILLSDGMGPSVIYCPHCRITTTVRAASPEVACQGCATTLAITDHFSRRIGAYLGYSAHAEEAS